MVHSTQKPQIMNRGDVKIGMHVTIGEDISDIYEIINLTDVAAVIWSKDSGNMVRLIEDLNLHEQYETAKQGVIRNDDLLPITQEFIESFGFKFDRHRASGYDDYLKDEPEGSYICLTFAVKSEYRKRSWYRLIQYKGDGEHSCVIFDGFECHTRSELRFLLTKGRIDCSK